MRVVAAGPADGALRRRRAAAASLPPLVFGAGVLWHLLRHGAPLRRGPHRVVPVLLAARRGARAAAAPLPARGRLARGVDARLLARVPRPASAAGSAGAVQRAVPARAASARSASRGCTRARLRARRRARRAHGARGRVRGAARAAPSPLPARAASWCSPAATSPRSACPRSCRRSPWRASACPSCAARSSATAPSAARCCGASPQHGLDDVVDVPGLRRRRAGGARARPARSAWCCRRAARATGWSWSRRPRAGTPSVVVAGPDNAATELVSEGVNGFVAPSRRARGPRRRDRARARGRASALRERDRGLVRAQRGAAVARRARSSACSRAIARAERAPVARHASARPCAPR